MEERYKFSNKVKDRAMMSLMVVNVGRQRCAPLYTWGPGVRDHFLIHYISRGRGRYSFAGRTEELCAGDVFLAYPDPEISYQADAEDPWTYEWVGFTGLDAPLLVDATDFTPEQRVLRGLSCGEELAKHLRRINSAFGNSFENAARMTGELYLTLSILISSASADHLPRTGAEETVERAVDYIDTRYSYPMTVEMIASYAGVSRSTLFRAFSSVAGVSPKEYLDRYRMRRAAELLRSSSLTVASIASSVGYDNGLYFSKSFHRIMGETPSGYREAHRRRKREQEGSFREAEREDERRTGGDEAGPAGAHESTMRREGEAAARPEEKETRRTGRSDQNGRYL